MPSRVIRLRQLTPGQKRRLAALKHVAALLDSAFVVPGTSYRIGLDPVLGLIPGLGDLVSPLFAVVVLWHSRELGVPKVVQLRMLANVAIDAVLGSVPLVGDLFDFAWKANDRNIAMLERHAYEERRASASDWLFVGFMMLVLLTIAAVPIVLAAVLFMAIRRLW